MKSGVALILFAGILFTISRAKIGYNSRAQVYVLSNNSGTGELCISESNNISAPIQINMNSAFSMSGINASIQFPKIHSL